MKKELEEKIKGGILFDELMALQKIQLYDKYTVTCRTENKLLGGQPKDPLMKLAMLEARANKGLVKESVVDRARAEVKLTSSDDPEEETEKAKLKSWTGFKSDDNGIYIESRQIKAGIKEATSTLQLAYTRRGARQVLQHALFVRGKEHSDKIYFYLDPEEGDENGERTRVVIPDGYEQLIAHVIGPQGPRSTIKLHDFVNADTFFEFEIWSADPQVKRVDVEFISRALALCQDNGFGCSRSQGYGRVKMLIIKKTAEGVRMKSVDKPDKPEVLKKNTPKKAAPKKTKAA